MNSPDAENPEPPVQPTPPAQAPRRGSGLMSRASQQFDMGDKGYLDEEERIIRNYDTNNDGSLQLEEVKKIVRDLRSANKGKTKFKNIAIGTSGVLALVLLANFGLIWAVLILTRQVETKGRNLVNPSTGEMLMSKSQGHGMKTKLNPQWQAIMDNMEAMDEDGRRNLKEQGSGEPWVHPIYRLNGESKHVRRLQLSAIATIADSRTQLQTVFDDYNSGTPTQATIQGTNGVLSETLSTGIVQVTTVPDDECDEDDGSPKLWRNIKAQGTTSPVYKVVCCNENDCELFAVSL